MRRILAEAIVDFLSFSGKPSDHLNELKGFHHREWERTRIWLHDAGLALYLLQKLKDTNATDILPREALSRLEENLSANRRRVTYMSRQFISLNQKFDAAGVKYVAVKGFSLVPQFCPDASLRHQSDFDYLVDRQSLPLAQYVLEGAGYSLKKHSANEFVFLMPSAWVPTLVDDRYEAHAAHAVELRLAFCDSDSHGVFLAESRFSVDNVRIHRWRELVLRALPEEDVFLLQVIHAFNHVLGGWVQMSWLYEIGYFLKEQSTDTSLWERIEHRIGGDPMLCEMVVVVTQLSARLFGAPLPVAFSTWAEELRPTVRIWIQNYARPWVFAKNRLDQFNLFSAAKVVLFLHQQYLPDIRARRHLVRMRLLPFEHLFRRVRLVAIESSTSFGGRRGQFERVFIRLLFQVTAGLRYLWEIPRWRQLNERIAHMTASTRRDSTTTNLASAKRPESTIQL